MLVYLFRRLIGAFLTLMFLTTLTFFLLRLVPGGPFDSEQVWPPEIQAHIAHEYELDQPIWIQWLHWLKNLCHGDLKESFQYIGHPVQKIIFESLPTSVFLGVLSLIFTISVGILLGCVAAHHENTLLDHFILLMSIAGLSLPTYLIASILIYAFSIHLGWFPPALWKNSASMILPILTLSWRPLGIIVRLTRASLLDVLKSDFIRTAYGKGLSKTQVIFKHALKNALIPVITILGPLIANLVAGSFVVEKVFQIPGIGKYFVQSVLNRDYPLVMGITLVYGVIFILSNILVDFLYAWIDPRIRLGES